MKYMDDHHKMLKQLKRLCKDIIKKIDKDTITCECIEMEADIDRIAEIRYPFSIKHNKVVGVRTIITVYENKDKR